MASKVTVSPRANKVKSGIPHININRQISIKINCVSVGGIEGPNIVSNLEKQIEQKKQNALDLEQQPESVDIILVKNYCFNNTLSTVFGFLLGVCGAVAILFIISLDRLPDRLRYVGASIVGVLCGGEGIVSILYNGGNLSGRNRKE